MKTIKISEETHQLIINYQNYLYQKINQKYTINEIINMSIENDYNEAKLTNKRIERMLKENDKN